MVAPLEVLKGRPLIYQVLQALVMPLEIRLPRMELHRRLVKRFVSHELISARDILAQDSARRLR
jgi:hypothetical protein